MDSSVPSGLFDSHSTHLDTTSQEVNKDSVFVSDSKDEIEENRKIRLFLAWLDSNGAKFPSLSWPRNDTASGIRGVIALKDINTEDKTMLQIPIHLMITPNNAFSDPVCGQILQKHAYDLLYGDFLLCIYIMIEFVKGKDSFYFPYLQILPKPSCLSEWFDEELKLLQVRVLS
jgi:hypothetical protein